MRSRRIEQPEPLAPTNSAKSPRRSKARTSSAGGTPAQGETGPKRRGRPRKSDIPSTGDEKLPVEEPPQPMRQGRPRLSNISATKNTPSKNAREKSLDAKTSRTSKAGTDGRGTAAKSPSRVSKALSSQDANMSVGGLDHELERSLPQVPKYRHIEPRTRQIPQSIISAKWSPLDDASIDAIAAILSDTTRPVLLRLRDKELRHQQDHNILRIFAGRLRSKLRKGMPFPPPTAKAVGSRGEQTADAVGGHVNELNFESTVDSIESLETMLDPLLHSVALLEKEKAKEEAALEKEYETLRTLESNAKAEARGWRERMKKAHPLAPEPLKQDGRPEVEGANEDGLALSKHESLPLSGLFDVSLVAYDSVPNDRLLTIATRRSRTRACWPCRSKSQATWRAYRIMSSRSRQSFLRWGRAGRRCRVSCKQNSRRTSSRRSFSADDEA